MHDFAATAGAEVPALSNLRPFVNADATIGPMAEQIGGMMSRAPIFIRNTALVAANDAGEMEPMDAERFTSWLEKWAQPFKHGAKSPYPVSIGKDKAAQVLRADQFRKRIRKITAVRQVRMPVLRPGGVLELLPAGYDEQTGNYVEDRIPFEEDWTIAKALTFFEGELGTWPWADKQKHMGDSPSCMGVLAAMIMQFCDAMLGEGQKRPAIVLDANQAGSGKSTIARMILAAVHGLATEADLPEDKAELMKLLQSAAIEGSPYLLFDDIGVFLKSPALNRFITASYHGGRIMHRQGQFRAPNVTQLLATGNLLDLSVDLVRRSVICKLFVAGEIQSRKFKHEISDDYLAATETRARYLAALWALVKHAHGVHPLHERGTLANRGTLQSFGRWFEIAQRVLASVPLFTGDPVAHERALATTGNRDDLEFRHLLISLADAMESAEHDYTREELVTQARNISVLEWLVGADGDGDLKPNDRQRLGRRLEAWKDRQLARTDGRLFEFSTTRRTEAGKKATVYRCRLV